MGILDGQLKPIPQGYAQAFGEYLTNQSPLLSGNLYSGVGGGYGNISLLGNDDDNDVEVTPSATTTSEAATTNTPPQVSQVEATKAAHSVGAQSYTDYVSAVNEGYKAYQQLFKESLKRKQALADKKVRSDRSTALANALGSLVNVFTAYGMAKKGDYAPIVAEYDSTPDTELKKSIAARYALENENEGLLMQLVKDRINSEAEIAKSKYERDVKYADDIAKAAIGDAKADRDLWKWRESEKNTNQRAKDALEQKDKQFKEAEAGRNARAKERNAVLAGKAAEERMSKGIYTEAQNKFILGVNNGKTDERETNKNGVKSTNEYPHKASKEEMYMFATIYNELEGNGIKGKDIEAATRIYNSLWKETPMGSAIGDRSILDIVVAGLKKKKSEAEIRTEIEAAYPIYFGM
jgi:hypothetical protein